MRQNLALSRTRGGPGVQRPPPRSTSAPGRCASRPNRPDAPTATLREPGQPGGDQLHRAAGHTHAQGVIQILTGPARQPEALPLPAQPPPRQPGPKPWPAAIYGAPAMASFGYESFSLLDINDRRLVFRQLTSNGPRWTASSGEIAGPPLRVYRTGATFTTAPPGPARSSDPGSGCRRPKHRSEASLASRMPPGLRAPRTPPGSPPHPRTAGCRCPPSAGRSAPAAGCRRAPPWPVLALP